ncbi:basic leucine zipper 6-like isoform X1 [Musa acuminata AAA Group]|uniref:basic leucine zipper 6-like isoform X1 n=1 Tax=Musa acuminata AAA Group TaxID=214697 RepID=UPI0031D2B0EE
MSWPAPLPPRCPFQSKGVPRRASDSAPQTPQNDTGSYAQNLMDEPPSWVDDLLAEPASGHRGISLRRSSSDPVSLLEVATSFQGPISPANEEDALSDSLLHESLEAAGASEVDGGFEAGSWVFGPNSPRQRSKLTDSESSIVTALLENVPSNPLQYLTVDYPSTSVTSKPHGMEDDYNPLANPDSHKLQRRHSGQRSRVRKLQYIAELERTVDMLQTLGADLATRVASLFQYRLALSMENKKLRQQIASLRQEKNIKDGQHQSLKNEAERLRMICGRHRRSKSVAACFEMDPSELDPSPINWQMLDLGKLNLGGSVFLWQRSKTTLSRRVVSFTWNCEQGKMLNYDVKVCTLADVISTATSHDLSNYYLFSEIHAFAHNGNYHLICL